MFVCLHGCLQTHSSRSACHSWAQAFLLTGHKLNMVRSTLVNRASDDLAGVAGLNYKDSPAKHRAPSVGYGVNYCSCNVEFEFSAVSATMVSVKSSGVHGSLFRQHQLWQLRLVAAFTNVIEKRSLSVICESYSNRKKFFLLTTNL